jgi:hypothetical protein
VLREGIQAGDHGGTRRARPSFDPVRPVVVVMILATVLLLVGLILLLSSGNTAYRPRRGRLVVFRRKSLRRLPAGDVFSDVA